jgi:hypothetical protein
VTGGLRKRAHSYLNVPSATVADGRLSFKARGILAYLLDKPAGWDVRSVAIAADSPDGKAAVQAGLRELARTGYYRIERRRLLDGRLVTGTAVSEEPVASWASEYAEYQGPVPVVQQRDGSYLVQHKDGSLTGDGFTNEPGPEPFAAEPEPDAGEPPGNGDGGVCAGHAGNQFSGAGSAGAGQTGAGSAGAGKPGAFIDTEEPLQRSSPLPPPPRLLPPTAAALREGEDRDLASGLGAVDALVAEAREIRPEWSSRSIRRALAHPDVAERGWDRARQAMLAVAADPESHQPGRLAYDGPWWNQSPAPGRGHCRPPWCGACDESTRMLGRYDGNMPSRCPRCHPLAARTSISATAGRAPEVGRNPTMQTAVSAASGGAAMSASAAAAGSEPVCLASARRSEAETELQRLAREVAKAQDSEKGPSEAKVTGLYERYADRRGARGCAAALVRQQLAALMMTAGKR